MNDIALTLETRNSLLSLQRTSRLQADTSQRLATGLKVQRATDDPVAFFQSRALTDRVGDLRDVKDNIGQALSHVEAALDGTEAINDLSRQLNGILNAAKSGNADQRAALAEQYNEIRNQLNALAGDASYQGTNLISSEPNDLGVRFNESGSSSTTIEGQPSNANGLGISAASSFNDFASDADIEAAITEIEGAVSTLRSQATSFGSDVALLNTREEFTENLSNTLTSGALKLTEADLNEEAAKQLALNVRSQLGIEALKIGQQSQLGVLQLFG